MQEVFLTLPVLASFNFIFLSGELLLHIMCRLHIYLGSFSHTSHAGFIFYLGSFCYTSRVGFIFIWGVSYTSRAGFKFIWGVSLTHPMLALFFYGLASVLCGEFLLHIPCWFCFYVGSFSSTTLATFVFIWGVSHTHPVLSWLLCKEFVLHIPYRLHFNLGNSFYKCHIGFIFIWGVSLTNPMLASFFQSGEFLLHIPCWIYFYLASFS